MAQYAETPAAKLASAARDRHRHGLPMFPDGAAVLATKPAPQPEGTANDPDESAPVVAKSLSGSRPRYPVTGRAARVVASNAPAPTEVLAQPAAVAARSLPPGFRARPRAGVHASGWPQEIVCERDGATLSLVPGGVFVQGRDDGRPEERPAHRVRLSSYYVDRHEVTARQFAAFRQRANAVADDRPAVEVSLEDARAYARWAGRSIPTEAQWEMAARATDARIHPWGNAPPAFPATRKPRQVEPVMSYPGDQSPYGVFDLAGNAWEWTSDWFDANAYDAFNGQEPVNPTGPARGAGRLPEVVVKGGSTNYDASWRTGMRPDATLPYLGFRCVLNVGDEPSAPALQPGGNDSPTVTVPF